MASKQARHVTSGNAQTKNSAFGLLTTKVFAAIPIKRTAAKIRTATPIATPRPWRVVRASPSAAKPIRPAAKA